MRKKLQRFADNAQSPYVIQPGKSLYQFIQGKWKTLQFKNQQDIVLELGCGKGEYTIGLAGLFPDKNFIGIDIKGPRMWVGSTQAKEAQLMNVAFLRTKIEHLDDFFSANEVAEIWIPFPDPRPGQRDEKRRLTSPRFLDLYRKILCPGARVHFKTDNTALFTYTLDLLRTQNIAIEYTQDLYNSSWLKDHTGIQTAYEKRFLEQGAKIKYLRFVPKPK